VPAGIDPDPASTARLSDAVAAALPGTARRGAVDLTPDELAAPFRAWR
jgi:hypothetical protein